MTDCDCSFEVRDAQQGKTLKVLFAINAFMFVAEMTAGIIGQSTALISDAMDMLADATVYGISLYAVGRAIGSKLLAARISGIGQILLGSGVLIDVVRRFIAGSEPVGELMIGVGLIALVANVICLLLIAKHRDGEIHMRASWIFSKNDVIANSGVILAGILTLIFDTAFFDLVIGVVIAVVVARGGMLILRDVEAQIQHPDSGQQ